MKKGTVSSSLLFTLSSVTILLHFQSGLGCLPPRPLRMQTLRLRLPLQALSRLPPRALPTTKTWLHEFKYVNLASNDITKMVRLSIFKIDVVMTSTINGIYISIGKFISSRKLISNKKIGIFSKLRRPKYMLQLLELKVRIEVYILCPEAILQLFWTCNGTFWTTEEKIIRFSTNTGVFTNFMKTYICHSSKEHKILENSFL